MTRLTEDGSLDPTFAVPGTGFDGTVFGVAVQADGKVVAVGFFSNLNGVPARGIARLNADGSHDTGFTAGSGFGSGSGFGTPYSAVQLPDGRLLVAGNFSSYRGTAAGSLVRIYS